MIMGPLTRASFHYAAGMYYTFVRSLANTEGHNSRWDYYRIGTGPETAGTAEREKKSDALWTPRLWTAAARHRMASTRHISIDIYVYTCNLRRAVFCGGFRPDPTSQLGSTVVV